MNRINCGRVIGGGVLAGIVIFFIMGAVNHLALGGYWQIWMAQAGPLWHHPSQHRSMALWFAESIVMGITGVWIYAGIRPRYGAGVLTAFRAGFLVWLAGHFSDALNQLALGLLSKHIIMGECVGGLIAVLLGTLAGAAPYKE